MDYNTTYSLFNNNIEIHTISMEDIGTNRSFKLMKMVLKAMENPAFTDILVVTNAPNVLSDLKKELDNNILYELCKLSETCLTYKSHIFRVCKPLDNIEQLNPNCCIVDCLSRIPDDILFGHNVITKLATQSTTKYAVKLLFLNQKRIIYTLSKNKNTQDKDIWLL